MQPVVLDLTVQFPKMNDKLSSLAIHGDCEVDVYENGDGSGAQSAYRFTALSLSEEAIHESRASRIVIRPLTPAEKDGVYVFADPNYNGKWYKAAATDDDLRAAGMYDNISSIRIEGPYAAFVGKNTMFRVSKPGDTQTFAYSNADLRDGNDFLNGYVNNVWNDTIRSIAPSLAPIGPVPVITK
jgi:hypothetical protein